MDFRTMTRTEVEYVAVNGNGIQEKEEAQTFLDWMVAIEEYGNDLVERSVNGIGSNPSTPPPPPPGM